MYVITGATGNTGSIVAEKLLTQGQKVRVIGRNADKLERFVKLGAEPFVGDAGDKAAVTRAFQGARVVYLMIPPSMTSQDYRAEQERYSDAYAAAVESAGVQHAVTLSSFGADKRDKTGPVVGLHNLEEKLNRIASLNVLHLRAGYFMENLLPQISLIQTMGIMGGPLRGDLQLPAIATRDIGAAAADRLLQLDFSGKQTRELLGPRDITMNEAAATIGKAIGKPKLSYQHFPGFMVKTAMTQMGISANVADLILEMAEALNSGHMAAREPRSPQNTTPTTLDTFAAEVFAPQFLGKAAGA
jgi:uncharacterized protein YbjT (DUF2867 family)